MYLNDVSRSMSSWSQSFFKWTLPAGYSTRILLYCWVHASKEFKLYWTPKRCPTHYYDCYYLADESDKVDLDLKQTDLNIWARSFKWLSSNMYNSCLHLCLCVCTFSVMSRSQESMLSMNRSSVLLPWLDPNTLWLAWNSWLQGGEDTLGTSSTHRGHYYPFLITII